MDDKIAKQKKAAALEARSTWVSPGRLGVIFVISLVLTIMFNGL